MKALQHAKHGYRGVVTVSKLNFQQPLKYLQIMPMQCLARSFAGLVINIIYGCRYEGGWQPRLPLVTSTIGVPVTYWLGNAGSED